MNKLIKTSENNRSHWFLFMLVPSFAVIAAVKMFRTPWAKNIVWAFVIFFGFTYAIGKESGTDDINRYVEELRTLYGKDLTVETSIKLFEDSGETDVLRTFLAIVVSRVTDRGEVLTGIYAIIFGFFFSRNIWYLLERIKGKIKPLTIILIAVFILLNPFWNINGFRFNTAIHIFMYGLLPYLYEGKKKGLLVTALSIFVHFSFIFPLGILALYYFLGNRLNFFFGFFVVSIFISEININSFNSLIEGYVPASFVERTQKYRTEDYVEMSRGINVDDDGLVEKVWYASQFLNVLFWSFRIFLIFIFFSDIKVIRQNKGLFNLLCFTYLFFGFSNTLASLPSMTRFLFIGCMCTAALFIFYIQNYRQYGRYINKLLLISVPALLLFIIVSIRIGFYSMSVTTLVGNPFFIFFNYNVSLNDLIK